MKTYTAPLSKPPPSVHQRPWDPWNSSSTGHQRREARRGETDPGETETSWRNRRNRMINRQFRQEDCSGDAAQDGLKPQKSVLEMLAKPGTMRQGLGLGSTGPLKATDDSSSTTTSTGKDKGIFDGLVIYVNGSTFPLISDHKLKNLLCEHGANMSLHLGRRKVTHVILGRATASSDYSTPTNTSLTHATSSSAIRSNNTQKAASLVGSAGGGLAGGKMEKEIKRVGGCGIKYVGVEWVLESIKAGKRLPEARFSNLKIASRGQGSVYGLCSKDTT